MIKAKEDNLQKRFLFKLSAKIISIPVGFLSLMIVPRGLGVKSYGDYNFITDFFTRLFGFLDSGTSTAFYTKISQRPQENTLLRFYWGFIIIMGSIVFLLILLLSILGLSKNIWIDQEPYLIWLGFFWGLLYWLNQIVQKIIDAYGLTVKGELATIKKIIIGFCLLLGIYISGSFSLLIFFLYHLLVFVLMLFLWWSVLKIFVRFAHLNISNRKLCL